MYPRINFDCVVLEYHCHINDYPPLKPFQDSTSSSTSIPTINDVNSLTTSDSGGIYETMVIQLGSFGKHRLYHPSLHLTPGSIVKCHLMKCSHLSGINNPNTYILVPAPSSNKVLSVVNNLANYSPNEPADISTKSSNSYDGFTIARRNDISIIDQLKSSGTQSTGLSDNANNIINTLLDNLFNTKNMTSKNDINGTDTFSKVHSGLNVSHTIDKIAGIEFCSTGVDNFGDVSSSTSVSSSSPVTVKNDSNSNTIRESTRREGSGDSSTFTITSGMSSSSSMSIGHDYDTYNLPKVLLKAIRNQDNVSPYHTGNHYNNDNYYYGFTNA